jgi:hypothetical protein
MVPHRMRESEIVNRLRYSLMFFLVEQPLSFIKYEEMLRTEQEMTI